MPAVLTRQRTPHCKATQPGSKPPQQVGCPAMPTWQQHLPRVNQPPHIPLCILRRRCSSNSTPHSRPPTLTCSPGPLQRRCMHSHPSPVSSSLLRSGSRITPLASHHSRPTCPPHPPSSAPMLHTLSTPKHIMLSLSALSCRYLLALAYQAPHHLGSFSSSSRGSSSHWRSQHKQGKSLDGRCTLERTQEACIFLSSSNSRQWGTSWLLVRPLLQQNKNACNRDLALFP